ncbi:MAG: alkaline phosphatase family protein [Bacteroidetes bacterium]|nr:alkaline phosphatase family protein [Bacteroidota bacterium]
MRNIFLLSILLLISGSVIGQKSQKPKLIAGPVVGSVTKNSAKIWIAYRGQGNNMLILGDTAEKRVYYPTSANSITDEKGNIALTMEFTGLKPDHKYNIIISIDGWGAHARYSFKTQSDTSVKDFNFLIGSCSLLQTDITQGVFPGGSNWIFYYMKRKRGDFMVWLGDNVYYLYKKHWSSFEGMFKRNLKIRKTYNHFYRDLLATTPNYAMWDDHDYGPNDADGTFALKDTALLIFKNFWPNTYPENENVKGNFFNFKYYDTEFFMTDGRYYRQKAGDSASAMLGEKQMLWLKNKLMFSDASFKFICLGTQILTANAFGETYMDYMKERNELLDFIADNNIKGVVFLTGDKHFSEVSTLKWKGYPMYDITCSPLTSPTLPRRLLGAYKNENRVPKSDFGFKNFGRISLSGEAGNRVAKLEFIDQTGVKKREFTIRAGELQKK